MDMNGRAPRLSSKERQIEVNIQFLRATQTCTRTSLRTCQGRCDPGRWRRDSNRQFSACLDNRFKFAQRLSRDQQGAVGAIQLEQLQVLRGNNIQLKLSYDHG